AGKRDGHGDRKIEAASLLAQLGGGQVPRQGLPGKLPPPVFYFGTHAFARFLDRRRGQTDEEEFGVAMTDVRLDFDSANVKAGEGAGVDGGEHRPRLTGRELDYSPGC